MEKVKAISDIFRKSEQRELVFEKYVDMTSLAQRVQKLKLSLSYILTCTLITYSFVLCNIYIRDASKKKGTPTRSLIDVSKFVILT